MTMTDDPDFLDELLTRYLDGEATDEDVARIEGDPELVARAADLRAAMELVAAPVAIPTAELDRIRAAAIAASATTTAVADLDARRAEKLQNRNRFLAAAAVFVFLAVGYAAVQSTGGDDDDTASIETSGADASTDDSAADRADSMGLSAEADDDAGDDGSDAAAGAEMADELEAAADTDMDSADDADDTAESADGDDSGGADEPDVLPDDLGAVANLAELSALLTELRATADAEERFAPPSEEDICDGLLAVVQAELTSALRSVEIAAVEVAGLPQRVALATGVDGTVVAVLIADEACAVIELLEIDGG